MAINRSMINPSFFFSQHFKVNFGQAFTSMPSRGRCSGTPVSAVYLRSEGQELEPWPVHPCCVVRQDTLMLRLLAQV